jgi:hypothetical protein
LGYTVVNSCPLYDIFERHNHFSVPDLSSTGLTGIRRVEIASFTPGEWKAHGVDRGSGGSRPYLNLLPNHPDKLLGGNLQVECLRQLFNQGDRPGWYGGLSIRGLPFYPGR